MRWILFFCFFKVLCTLWFSSYAIMKTCWNLEPTERPTFSKIAHMVQKLIGDQPEQEPVSVQCSVRPSDHLMWANHSRSTPTLRDDPFPTFIGFILKLTSYMHVFVIVCSESTRICNRRTLRLKCVRSPSAATAHVTSLVTTSKRSRPWWTPTITSSVEKPKQSLQPASRRTVGSAPRFYPPPLDRQQSSLLYFVS